MVTENRLNLARKYLDDAKMLLQDGRWNSTIGRAYYASYQAMWSALGEPKEGSENAVQTVEAVLKVIQEGG